MAESAVIGLLRTLLASARSTMTTWLASLTFSRTQMKWSDSNVRVYIEDTAGSHQDNVGKLAIEETNLKRNGGRLDANGRELKMFTERDGLGDIHD